MPVNYTISSHVIDLRSDQPRSDDIYLVDTNIWYWLTYTRASMSPQPPAGHQTTDYPNYIAKAIAAGAKLLWSGLSLSELAHIIERTEKHIFNDTLPAKIFRHNHPNERANVVTQIETAWAQVKSMALPLENFVVDNHRTDEALSRLTASRLDGYDAFIVNSILNQDIIKVITDDGDYTSVAGLQVYTANYNALQASIRQGKIIVR